MYSSAGVGKNIQVYPRRRRQDLVGRLPFTLKTLSDTKTNGAHPDGEYRWFLVRAVPLCDERGNILKWYGILTDIEDRKQAERALAKSEERWRAVFENSAIGVALY
jgi:PAS domain S-box-containing protein